MRKDNLLITACICFTIVLSTVIYIYGNRYELNSSSGNDISLVYKIDKWTGEVWVVGPRGYEKLYNLEN